MKHSSSNVTVRDSEVKTNTKIQQKEEVESEEHREPAKVVNGAAAVVFTEDDLRRLGINPDKATHLRARIMSGAVLIEGECA